MGMKQIAKIISQNQIQGSKILVSENGSIESLTDMASSSSEHIQVCVRTRPTAHFASDFIQIDPRKNVR